MDSTNDEKIKQAIESYYSYKSKYTTELKKIQKKIYEKTDLSDQERKQELNSKNPKCVNCGRQVGSIFSEKNRHLKIACGDKSKPCDLNFHVYIGKKENINDLLENTQQMIKEIKEKIIKLKLDLTYNYKTQEEIIEEFTSVKKEYIDLQKINDTLVNKKVKYLNETNNKKSNDELFFHINNSINRIKKAIDIFIETKDLQEISKVISIYNDELIEKYQEINKNKYKQMYVLRDNDDFYLIQDKINTKDMFVSLFDDEKSKIM